MIKTQTYCHIDAKSLPKNIKIVVTTLCRELNIQSWSGSVLRWVVSDQQIDVCPSDADYDKAANALNKYLTKLSNPSFEGGSILYIDL